MHTITTFRNDSTSWKQKEEDKDQINKINYEKYKEGDDKNIIFILLSRQNEEKIACQLLPKHIIRLHQCADERSTRINNAVIIINEFYELRDHLLINNQKFKNFKKSMLMTKLFAGSLASLYRKEVHKTLKNFGKDVEEPLKSKLQRLEVRYSYSQKEATECITCSKRLEEIAEAKRVKKIRNQELYNESEMLLVDSLKDCEKANEEWSQTDDYKIYQNKKLDICQSLGEIAIFCTKNELLGHHNLTRASALRIAKLVNS